MEDQDNRDLDENADSDTEDDKTPACVGTSDWSRSAVASSHVLVDISSNKEGCFLGGECQVPGPAKMMRCTVCRITCHKGCMQLLLHRMPCRITFQDDVRMYRERPLVQHHWVPRRQIKGKCKNCSKGFTSRPKFVGVSCSWCKASYHIGNNCQIVQEQDTVCDNGAFAPLIVSPSWIVKLPKSSKFKSSLKHCPSVPAKNKAANSGPTFVIKFNPLSSCSPLLVFVNPKSGGNQGAKLMQKLQWLLNPRQVFDLTQGGPGPAINMFLGVPGTRMLVCGGDGTVGWVLSALDRVYADVQPAVGVLPLGTGNDLARSLGWGGGYTGLEPLETILAGHQAAEVVNMDRWRLTVTINKDAKAEENGKDELPLDVVNNYFSIGVDAQIALDFHEAREANPSKFNSRIKNKIFYTMAGGKDLLVRSWRSLTDHITVECDGKDVTPELKRHKVHSVIFCNIACYGSGTRPWNRAAGEQKMDDGLIEVIGITTQQLPLLQSGGHGYCIAQCKQANITTNRTIPMQVDGEASRLNPATINLSLLNQAKMLVKTKKGSYKGENKELAPAPFKVVASWISMADYQRYCYETAMLEGKATLIGEIEADVATNLDHVRSSLVNIECNLACDGLWSNWCFLDSVTANRFFRIDRANELLHFIGDVCKEHLYILVTLENTVMHQYTTTNATIETNRHQESPNIEPNERINKINNQDEPQNNISPNKSIGKTNNNEESQNYTSPNKSIEKTNNNEESQSISSNKSIGETSKNEELRNKSPKSIEKNNNDVPPSLSANNPIEETNNHAESQKMSPNKSINNQEESQNMSPSESIKKQNYHQDIENEALENHQEYHNSMSIISPNNFSRKSPYRISNGFYEDSSYGDTNRHRISNGFYEDSCYGDINLCKSISAFQLSGKVVPPFPSLSAGIPLHSTNSLQTNVLEKTTEGVLKAARLGDLALLSSLYQRGYSLLAIDHTGKTGLHYGARFGSEEVVRFLLAWAPGSIMDMQDNEKGHTAMHKAAAYKQKKICRMLVAAGASVLIPDVTGRTPGQLTQGDQDLKEYLISQEHFQITAQDGEETVV